jgi:membrane protein YdbS with pleckstrin-like domain
VNFWFGFNKNASQRQPVGVSFRLRQRGVLSGGAMKNIVIFLACSIALTVVLYEIADYLTPGSPSEEMTFLLAVIAMVLVWLVHCAIRVSRHKKDPQAVR